MRHIEFRSGDTIIVADGRHYLVFDNDLGISKIKIAGELMIEMIDLNHYTNYNNDVSPKMHIIRHERNGTVLYRRNERAWVVIKEY